MRLLLIFFIIVPIIEMVILIKVGGIIGALPTVALVVLTATLGIWLLKREGLATLTRVQQKFALGQMPETELLEGLMLLIGGALLLTPGFVTDAIGFACLLPASRRPIARWLTRQGLHGAINRMGRGASIHTGGQGQSRTIEGEFTNEDRRQ
jgi:UPF0716 protein FxsA